MVFIRFSMPVARIVVLAGCIVPAAMMLAGFIISVISMMFSTRPVVTVKGKLTVPGSVVIGTMTARMVISGTMILLILVISIGFVVLPAPGMLIVATVVG